MSIAARDLAEMRSARDAARATREARVTQVRADLEARGVGGRIADKLSVEAREALDEGLAVASESKGIIAGLAAALVLWFMRNPIIGWIGQALDHDDDETDWEDEND